tara:strand:- start:1705 stop:2148 length:444 start_codon:yes stop_codon:yes gene_type:complete
MENFNNFTNTSLLDDINNSEPMWQFLLCIVLFFSILFIILLEEEKYRKINICFWPFFLLGDYLKCIYFIVCCFLECILRSINKCKEIFMYNLVCLKKNVEQCNLFFPKKSNIQDAIIIQFMNGEDIVSTTSINLSHFDTCLAVAEPV